jgi:hypothetical protein
VVHPSTTSILRYFSYDHLPSNLQSISKPFCDLAHSLVGELDLSGPELTVGLRKLLEAKDCAVRAALDRGVS